jgi:hypothetical protein
MLKITAEQESKIRNMIIGADVTTSFLSLIDERTLLIRTSHIVAIESRPPGAKWPYDPLQAWPHPASTAIATQTPKA